MLHCGHYKWRPKTGGRENTWKVITELMGKGAYGLDWAVAIYNERSGPNFQLFMYLYQHDLVTHWISTMKKE